ncbi:DUF2018 family protein [Sulfurimonas sp. HSL-3221]|uniref:DUF2018 family protein n=1 Tax=Sulfurimonas diazotrophicus TaxID=3131939 RepID=A0ABZ3HBT0_9BACT|nr:DUF2018 family protein [Sulfurimonas sp. HSL-3221]UFS63442.1 DUF2018 family protein [Sulfurimonas sp. HSL-3221]
MYEALFEDEGDMFSGSPRSKFMDVIFNANRSVAEGELQRLIERLAAMEKILSESMDDATLERTIKQLQFEEADAINAMAKELYIESMGNVLSQSE